MKTAIPSPQSHCSGAQQRMPSKCSRAVATNSVDYKFVLLQSSNSGELQPQSLSRGFRVTDDCKAVRNAQAESTSCCFYFSPFPGNFSWLHPTVLLQRSFGKPFLRIRIPPHKGVSAVLRIVARSNTAFLPVVLCICQDKALWYCIGLYFVQKILVTSEAVSVAQLWFKEW